MSADGPRDTIQQAATSDDHADAAATANNAAPPSEANDTLGRRAPAPLIAVFKKDTTAGWPEDVAKPGERQKVAPHVERMSLGDALATRHSYDTHFVAYCAGLELRMRIAFFDDAVVKEALRRRGLSDEKVAAAMRVKRSVNMVAFVVDIDDPVGHAAGSGARDEWRAVEREKVEALRQEYPDVFVYETKGGYRIVLLLAQPFKIASHDDYRLGWRRFYIASLASLSRRFGIVADPRCADWTRCFRAPRVVRDGKREDRPSYGDPHAIGAWDYAPTDEDEKELDRLATDPATECAWRSARRSASPDRDDTNNRHHSNADRSNIDDTGASQDLTLEEVKARWNALTDKQRQQRTVRAKKYIGAISPEGCGKGAGLTWKVAGALVRGFMLPAEVGFPVIAKWNEGRVPPRTEAELRHKLADGATRSTRPWGYLIGEPEGGQGDERGHTGTTEDRSAKDVGEQVPADDDPVATLTVDQIDAAIKASSPDLKGAEFSAWSARIMDTLARHDAAIQDCYLKQLKTKFGIGMGVLRNLLKDAKRRAASASGFTRSDHVDLAEHGLFDLRRGSPEALVFAEGQLYRFIVETGLWSPIDFDEQCRMIVGYAPSHGLEIEAKDMTGALKVAHRIAGRSQFFAEAATGIAFSNGFLSWKNNKIEFAELGPEHRARVALPFAYRPNGRARRWHKFLRQCFKGDGDIKGKIRLLQEFTGACLLGVATKFGKVLVMLGRGANGKSVFLRVLATLFPSAARSSIAPQKFDNDYFLARLAGVRINIVGELPEGELLQSEIFKAVVTGLDEVTSRQIYAEPVRFTPKAGHIFAANKLPGTADQTHGFWRRLMVVEWPRIFDERAQDKDLGDTLIATEMAAIAAWVVEGAVRVLERGRYDIPKSVENAVEAWRQGADPVALFKNEQTVPARTKSAKEQLGKDISVKFPWTKASALYDLFRIWVEKNGFKQLSIKTFGERLTALEVPKEKREEGWYYALTPIDDAICAVCGGFRRPGIEHAC